MSHGLECAGYVPNMGTYYGNKFDVGHAEIVETTFYLSMEASSG
jgi:hypothetical protein